jgi:hypothetical protein
VPVITTVVTAIEVAAPVEAVWGSMMFYEQIRKRPPWLLRLVLPVPLRTEGHPTEVGGEIRCVYPSGYLIKRVTRMSRGWNYDFEVFEQNLSLGGGIKLVGGSYTLSDLPGERTKVTLETVYQSPHRPRWLCQWFEARVCRLFHRHILNAVGDAVALDQHMKGK